MERKINEQISYIETSDNPLCADIGIIKETSGLWLFDVGNGIDNIKSLDQCYNVVISHFHLDHLGNINRIKINDLYVSKETYKYLPKEVIEKANVIIVNEDINIDKLHIFPIPSSHSKGSLALEVDETYCFLGDATYCRFKNGKLSYNAQLLKEEIELIKSLKSKYLLISHFKGLIRTKDEVLKELEEIYALRTKNSPEIIISQQ